MPHVRTIALALVLYGAALSGAGAADWNETVAKARGQTVEFNAWGGLPQANAYIAWAGEAVKARYGIELRHVSVTDTAEAVAQVRSEKQAGRAEGGSVDLLWINGKNFAAMKAEGLLYGPIADRIPNHALVDTDTRPTTVDFTLTVGGMGVPWGLAQLVFVHDTALLPNPPRSIPALLKWASTNPGRFTYPRPPSGPGNSFLVQALMELGSDWTSLMQPATDENFHLVTEALWPYLDELHPLLWRGGKVFPASGVELRGLLSEKKVDLAVAFSTLEAASGIEAGVLPSTARVYTLEAGTVGNASFLAIPSNANDKEGAMVVIDFLLSPEAQARKQDPRRWGSASVLDPRKLAPDQRALLEGGAGHPAAPRPEEIAPVLPQPHPSWTERIEKEWQRRYAGG